MFAGDLPCHVVTSFLQFNHSLAAVASLPTLFLRHLDHAVGLLVLWTLAPTVKLAIAEYANFGIAPTTTSVFSLSSQIYTYLGWLNPLATAPRRTVEPILRGVFLIFFVPERLEFVVKEPLGVFKRNMILGAASWRHVLWILY
jgi:hypothetical protein